MKSNIAALLVAISTLMALPAFAAKELKSGEFTMVKNQVEHTSGSSKLPAKTKDQLEEKSVVDTGAASLSELGFDDSSVLRLGSNTQFSFQSKERIIKLDKGTMLMNVPPGNGGITVDGGGVTGAVSGTTIMVSRDDQGNFGFMILEGAGGGTVIGKDGIPVNIVAGQMAMAPHDGKPTTVVEVHVDAIRDVSPLFQDFPTNLNGSDKVLVTTDSQSEEIQNDLKLLSSLKDFELTQADPEGVALAMICGVGQDEMGAAKNILLRPVDTAAGAEELASASSSAPAAVQAAIGSLNGVAGAASGMASSGAVLASVSSTLQGAANSGDTKSLQALTFAAVSAIGQSDPGAVQAVVSGLISSIAGSPQASEAAQVIAAAAIVTASNFGQAAAQAASAGATAGALASGNPSLVQAVSQGLANGTAAIVQGTIVAAGAETPPADARQEGAAPLVAASSPPSSGDGGLGGTDTAAGGDVADTDTAAGGGRGADTQAPAPVSGRITANEPQATPGASNTISGS